MDILHSKQLIMNPLRDEKLTRFCETLELPANSRVVDIGCGKGEFLHRLYTMYGVSGSISRLIASRTVMSRKRNEPQKQT